MVEIFADSNLNDQSIEPNLTEELKARLKNLDKITLKRGNNRQTIYDSYGVLGIDPESTEEEIKKAHRKLIRAVHPDTTTDDRGTTELAQIVNEAYSILSDIELKTFFDTIRKGHMSALERIIFSYKENRNDLSLKEQGDQWDLLKKDQNYNDLREKIRRVQASDELVSLAVSCDPWILPKRDYSGGDSYNRLVKLGFSFIGEEGAFYIGIPPLNEKNNSDWVRDRGGGYSFYIKRGWDNIFYTLVTCDQSYLVEVKKR